MRCFVINLDRETARLAWMTDAFDKMGLGFQRFSAVNKDQLSDDAIRQVAGGGWSHGEIACFLSHVEVWKLIAAGDDGHAAVFEDDVHFSRHASQFLRSSSWVPTGIDLVKLETTLVPVATGPGGIEMEGHRLLRLRSFHNGSAGYIISKRLAAKLVADAARIDRPLDDFVFEKHMASCWQMSPALCVQDMFLSTAGSVLESSLEQGRMSARGARRWKPRHSVWQRIFREIRRVSSKITRLPRRSVVPIEILERP